MSRPAANEYGRGEAGGFEPHALPIPAGFFMRCDNAAMLSDIFGIPIYVVALCIVVLLLAIQRFGRPRR
jgi:hypothetical protein